MLRSVVAKVGQRGAYQQVALCSTLRESIYEHSSPASAIPLLEQYRPRWPQLPITKLAEEGECRGVLPIPETRTISASLLRFEMRATFSHGSSLIYEHMAINPADFKVGVKVFLADLALTKEEEYILIRMLAKRFNTGNREIRLTSERFPNRIENKRYLIYLLENLVAEAKKLAVIQREMLLATEKACEQDTGDLTKGNAEISEETTVPTI